MPGQSGRLAPWWHGVAVSRERRLKQLLFDRRELRGALVGRAVAGVGGAEEDAVYLSGTLVDPPPWRKGDGVAAHAIQERPSDPERASVRCAAAVLLVRDLGDGRTLVIARVHDAERLGVVRQNWPEAGDCAGVRPHP